MPSLILLGAGLFPSQVSHGGAALTDFPVQKYTCLDVQHEAKQLNMQFEILFQNVIKLLICRSF